MVGKKVVDESDSDVPPSERGKGENMSMEERSPDRVFGLVALSYLVVLLIVVLGFVFWMFI